jgi:hypothetical protein
VLPDDVAREFPDTETTVEALRLVIKLRSLRSAPGNQRAASAKDPPGAKRVRTVRIAKR